MRKRKQGKVELHIIIEAMNRICDRCKEGFIFADACKMNGISPATGEQWRRMSQQFDEGILKALTFKER